MFDAAKRLLVVDVEGSAEVQRWEERIEEEGVATRVEKVAALGVDSLICGAISRPLEASLVSVGVRVIPQTCGPVEDVLSAFIARRLTDEAFLMPGCCGRRRRLGLARKRSEPAGHAEESHGTGSDISGTRSG